MSKLRWAKARESVLIKASLLDEIEGTKADAAARWLARQERTAEAPKDRRARHKASHRPTGTVVYADGACEPNPGKGGWGFVVYKNGVEHYADCGGSLSTTNNEMEMTAALRALEWIRDNANGEPMRLFCDSQYVVKGCNDWRHGWARKGWRKGGGKPLANEALWREIDGVLRERPQIVEWVKGHAGIAGNERADDLSNQGRLEAIRQSKSLDLIRDQLRGSEGGVL